MIVAGHRFAHRTGYRDSVLIVDPPEVERLGEDVAILHVEGRLVVGATHPAGPHRMDTLMLIVATRRADGWRIKVAETVALTDPATIRLQLRPD